MKRNMQFRYSPERVSIMDNESENIYICDSMIESKVGLVSDMRSLTCWKNVGLIIVFSLNFHQISVYSLALIYFLCSLNYGILSNYSQNRITTVAVNNSCQNYICNYSQLDETRA